MAKSNKRPYQQSISLFRIHNLNKQLNFNYLKLSTNIFAGNCMDPHGRFMRKMFQAVHTQLPQVLK